VLFPVELDLSVSQIFNKQWKKLPDDALLEQLARGRGERGSGIHSVAVAA
jgi:hypothetical protein